MMPCRMHGAHHQAPFEGNYAIVSGIWNPLLDNSGFFRGLEKVVHATLGVEPRCWSMPDNDWAELEQPPAPSA
jgi:ubiquitin-conjugating enzyme E2 variant